MKESRTEIRLKVDFYNILQNAPLFEGKLIEDDYNEVNINKSVIIAIKLS